MKRYFYCIFGFCIAWNVQLSGNIGKDELRERIYVQTDKQLYLAGEQIRMKLLTTDTEQIPLVLSKMAYIELVDLVVARIQIMVELSDGTGEGQMQIPADMPTGYYRLIAYTQYMRNEGSEVFFEKNIAVVNTYQSGYQPEEEETATEKQFLPDMENRSGSISLQPDQSIYSPRARGELMLNGLPENIHTLSVTISGREWTPVAGTAVSLFRQNQTKPSTEFTGKFFPEYEGHIVTGKIIDNQTGTAVSGEIMPPVRQSGIDREIQSTTRQPGIDGDARQPVVENKTMSVLDSLLQVLQQNTSDEQLQKTIQIIVASVEQLKSNEQNKIIENQTDFGAIEDESPETNENILSMVVPFLSFPGDGIRIFPGQKTETGDFRFFTSGITGMKEIATVVYAVDDNYRIDVQSPFVTRFDPKPVPALHIDSANYDQLLKRSVALQVLHYFSDDPSDNRNIAEPFFKMKPSISYPLDEYTRFTTMREVFTEFINGARFRRTDGRWRLSTFVKRGAYYNYGTVALVLLDGVPVSDHEIIFNYDPLSVEKINIYYGPCNMGGYQFDGIIELITYRRLHQDLNPGKSTQIISFNGPQTYNQLITNDYSDIRNRQSRTPDTRHTLLWNPDVRTEGKTAIRLPFDTSDLTGEFQATVEGITKDGQFIFTTAVFKVE